MVSLRKKKKKFYMGQRHVDRNNNVLGFSSQVVKYRGHFVISFIHTLLSVCNTQSHPATSPLSTLHEIAL